MSISTFILERLFIWTVKSSIVTCLPYVGLKMIVVKKKNKVTEIKKIFSQYLRIVKVLIRFERIEQKSLNFFTDWNNYDYFCIFCQ